MTGVARRRDNVGIGLGDINTAIEFFADPGLVLEERAPVEGDWVEGFWVGAERPLVCTRTVECDQV